MSATAACLAAIRRRSGAFDSAEDRQRKRNSNLSSGSNSGELAFATELSMPCGSGMETHPGIGYCLQEQPAH